MGAALHALAAGALALWAGLHLRAGLLPLLGVAPVVAAGAGWIAWRGWSVDTGELAWDGAQWSFADERGHAHVAIDLGRWLLLRFEPTGPGRGAWLALDPRMAGAAWHGLRAALYCRGRDDAEPPR